MIVPASLSKQQGYYRYNPIGIGRGGPARIFPYSGEDGILRFVLEKLQRNAIEQGKVSEPLSLLLQRVEAALNRAEETWLQLGTLLADCKIFQSGWANFDLPPGEQFNSSFAKKRKEIGRVLDAAKRAVGSTRPTELQRLEFYRALEKEGKTRPIASSIYEREGGLSDREFARQRLAGLNPMRIRKARESDRNLLQNCAARGVQAIVDGETLALEDAAARHRIFIVDYPLLEGLSAEKLQLGRYAGSPIALLSFSEGALEPISIQLERGGKCFAPPPSGDAGEWMRAKLYVQVADSIHHQLIDHLCYTHLAMEAFAIATARQLPPTHPFYQLLHPHFQFLLAVNDRSNVILLKENGKVERLIALTGETSQEVIERAYRQRPFEDYSFPNNIQRRGVSEEFLPEFPYRDDARLLWEEIERYVSDYLQRYYRDDSEVQRDVYIQAWAAELGAPLNSRPLTDFPQIPAWLPPEVSRQIGLTLESLPDYPRVPEFPTSAADNLLLGMVDGLQRLTAIATTIIFTCGPQHAAVNFNQFDYGGYVPNYPLSARARPDVATSIEEILPLATRDLEQMEITFALSEIRWGRLGCSDLIKYWDSGADRILKRFQTGLDKIETEIKTRNQQRLFRHQVEYPYLLPSQIPNSINI